MGWNCPRCGALLLATGLMPNQEDDLYKCPKDGSVWEVTAGDQPRIYQHAILLCRYDGEKAKA